MHARACWVKKAQIKDKIPEQGAALLRDSGFWVDLVKPLQNTCSDEDEVFSDQQIGVFAGDQDAVSTLKVDTRQVVAHAPYFDIGFCQTTELDLVCTVFEVHDPVVARLHVEAEGVGTCIATKKIIVLSSLENVVTCAAFNKVIAAATGEDVGAGVTMKAIIEI